METIKDKLSKYQHYKQVLYESQNEWIENAKNNIKEINYDLFKEIVYSDIEKSIDFNNDVLNLLGLEITDTNDFGLYYLNEDCDKIVMKIIEIDSSLEKYNEYLEKLSEL